MEKQIVRFGSKESRLGDHSYSGYWTGYYLCDGASHYEVDVPQGMFSGQHRTSSSKIGDCDKQVCAKGELVAVEKLPSAAQEALGILVPVPDGKLLVEQCSAPFLQHFTDFYRVVKAGEMVTPRRLANGKVIAHGETVEVSETRHNTKGSEWTVRVIVRNEQGEPVIEDGEKEERKQFARDQIAYLVSLGFSQGRAYRIMKAAGPGQVQRAVEWAYEAVEHVSGNTDALDMVLSGLGGTNGFGTDRTAAALEALGFSVPRASTAHQFFGTLRGAKEAVLAGLPARESATV